MMNRRGQREAAARFDERRKREDDSPRLQAVAPTLKTLKLSLEEFRAGGQSALVSHTRHVVVARAPALVIVPCSDRDCDGDHDLTREILRHIENSREEFSGQDECYGVRNGTTCHIELRYQASATYGS